MSMQVPVFPDPTRATPISNAYAWIEGIRINVVENSLQLSVPVWASVEDYNAGTAPVRTEIVVFGQGNLPDLATFIASNQEAWNAMGAAFYGALSAVPVFADAIQVP